MLNFFKLFFFILVVTSCSRAPISVQTEYLTIEHLASYTVETPDPRLHHPPIGQRLMIFWSVPKCYPITDNMSLLLKVRFRNDEQQELSIPIQCRSGNYLFDIIDERYCETGGILTYKIDMVMDSQIIEQWRHQLWTDLIEIGPTEENE